MRHTHFLLYLYISFLYVFFLSTILFSLFLSCGPMPDTREFVADDIHPPIFIGSGAVDEKTFSLSFSEKARISTENLTISPDIPVDSLVWHDQTCRIDLAEAMEPGAEYSIEATARDEKGNSLTFLTHIYGYNPAVPEIRLNEITTQGSSSNPDKVELKVLSAGNTAGLALYEGVDTSYTYRKILPPIEVKKGDYIVVHFKPKGVPEETDEISDPSSCTAEESIAGSWDLWIEGGGGISGNNGVIALYRSTTGPLIDGFLYSNRTSSSDENYRGFGTTRALERADRLIEQDGWKCEERLPAPEDAVDPEDSTATRSICRMPDGEDSDSAKDWHIVPTRGATFGKVNNTEVYVP